MKKIGLLLLFLSAALPALRAQGRPSYDVATYLYPAYVSDDPRLRPFWPKGIGEWETVQTMQERNPGHYWDRKPLWGWIDEADPAVMEMEIDQAAGHGINVFIFDWYWFDGRPFMETTLTNGFLKAPNRDRMQFYLMWANHDVLNYWDTRIAHLGEENVIWRGAVGREEFEKVCLRYIEHFFRQPNYYKIDGRPVLMIYDVKSFIDGLGGVDEAADAVKRFRRQVRKAGFPDLELQLTMWGPNLNYSGFDAGKSDKPHDAFVRRIGFDSSSHYQFCHFLNVDDEYPHLAEQAAAEWERLERDFSIPYYPHVSVGWDNSPRTRQSAVVRNNTPENFEQALRKAKAYVDARPQLHPLITINSWNEWTETSYLQPDNVYGYGYLDAVKRVFVDKP
jgi:hypothetical protein